MGVIKQHSEILGIKMFGKHSFDLEKQFTFYASYHNNPINVLIHILCIWPILATGLVILQYTPELLAQPELFKSIPDGQYLKINVAFCWFDWCNFGFDPLYYCCQISWNWGYCWRS